MNPIFEFVGTTISTKISKKKGGKDILKNRVYVVKKTLNDGSVFYMEYTISKVNSTTVALRCCNRKCHSTLALETSHEIIIERTHIEPSGKKRNIYNFSKEADLADDSLYGLAYHDHSYSAKCRDLNNYNECKTTIHIAECQYETKKSPIEKRTFTEKAISIAKNDKSLSASTIIKAMDIVDCKTGTNIPAAERYIQNDIKKILVQKRIWQARGAERKSHREDHAEIPDDVRTFARRESNGDVRTEDFIFPCGEHIICVLPSELNRLVDSDWILDATFKSTNSMVGFYQTLIITIKYEVQDRVFLYPVVFCMMRTKSRNAYVDVLNDLKRIHAYYNVVFSTTNKVSIDFCSRFLANNFINFRS